MSLRVICNTSAPQIICVASEIGQGTDKNCEASSFLTLLLLFPGMCLNELIINPHQQHMDAFYWVIDWEGMISVSSLVGLLEKHFFPKWLQVRNYQG